MQYVRLFWRLTLHCSVLLCIGLTSPRLSRCSPAQQAPRSKSCCDWYIPLFSRQSQRWFRAPTEEVKALSPQISFKRISPDAPRSPPLLPLSLLNDEATPPLVHPYHGFSVSLLGGKRSSRDVEAYFSGVYQTCCPKIVPLLLRRRSSFCVLVISSRAACSCAR